MFHLHVYVCIVHDTVYEMHYYVLLGRGKYNCEAPGEGPLRGPPGGLQLSSAGTALLMFSDVFLA